MNDWTSFLFTGSNVLPAYMVAVNEDALSLALMLYVMLMLAAMFAGLSDENSPARRAAARQENDSRENDGR
jgi:hypothetical protein